MANTPNARIGIVGGSGLYQIEGLKNVAEVKPDTPWGSPSDAIITGELSGVPVAFLPRHGRGHRFLPSEIPQRANMYALKSIGVRAVISVSAVGSLRQELAPRHFVLPNQMVDETKGRDYSFFGEGVVGHVSFARPFCETVSSVLYEGALKIGVTAHKGGTLIVMEGPQFSPKAESEYHRRMGYDLIGMTASPEARLAREAQMCYAPVCLVTDYDTWKDGEEVTGEQVLEVLTYNISHVKSLITEVVPQLAKVMNENCHCRKSLAGSIYTAKEYITPSKQQMLDMLLK